MAVALVVVVVVVVVVVARGVARMAVAGQAKAVAGAVGGGGRNH